MISLLNNYKAYRKAQQEMDRVVGNSSIKFEHMAQLKYLQACLRESLRMYLTAPAFARQVLEETDELICGGRYRMPKRLSIVCFLGAIQQDHAVYGEGAPTYEPERMFDERFMDLPNDSWKVRLYILDPAAPRCAC